MAKLPHLVGIWTGGDGLRVIASLITTRNLENTPLSTWFLAWLGWRINGKAISSVITIFTSHICGTLPTPTRKPHPCDPFGTKWLQSMNGGRMLLRLLSLNNMFFAFLTRAKSIKEKFGDCIQAQRAWRWPTTIMHELCEVRTGNYITFNWKQTLFWGEDP